MKKQELILELEKFKMENRIIGLIFLFELIPLLITGSVYWAVGGGLIGAIIANMIESWRIFRE